MRAVKVPGGPPRIFTTGYVRFRGVDMSTDPALIDRSRAAEAVNLISDSGGFPEKRVGFKTVKTLPGRINGLFRTVIGDIEHLIAHSGGSFYRFAEDEGEPELLYSGAADEKSFALNFGGKLWILTGSEFLCFDGEEMRAVSEIAYAPTTVISASPSGGGEAFEAVNLLTPKRKNSFLGDGESVDYYLDAQNIDSVEGVYVDGVEVSDYTADLEAGKVTFATPPGESAVTGEDNVLIAFSKTVEGYAEAINKCRFAAMYGFGGDEGERMFFAGNPDHKNVDWHCGIHAPDYAVDPTYVPDTSFAWVGSDENPINAYLRFGQYLAIIKGENAQDASVFLRACGLDASGKAVFPIEQGCVGVGCLSPFSAANLLGEPLFLSKNGVYGLVSADVDNFCALQNRSFYADAGLRAEPDLEDAVAAVWDGRYILAVNGNCYVLDGRQQKSYKAQSGGDYLYECFFWTGIPARVLFSFGSKLYFGTDDGRICRFKNDAGDMSRYTDDGRAIVARWATKADYDGDFGRYKKLLRRGLAVMVKPYTRSSAKVYLTSDSRSKALAGETTVDIFDFGDVDFMRFSFNAMSTPQVFALEAGMQKYVTLQITVENDRPGEGFGVYGIVKRFSYGNYVK